MTDDDRAKRAVITRRLLLGHGVTASLVLPAADPATAAGRRASLLGVPPAAAPPMAASPRPPARVLPLIMLDPGHGGKDPGATGISGTYEKHVAFAAALELRRQLEASGRYRVELTRTRDEFIPLEERVGRAQLRGAQLFVSMHADATADSTVRGASVYTLSDTASDAQTEALARRENAADRFAGPAFRDAPPEVARILASLVRQETRTGSARLARALVREFERSLRLLSNPSRHAGFMVLKAADIPSILVEMGFMSNRADEAELQLPEHRALVAAAMKRAVDGYFNATPGNTAPGITAQAGRTAG